MLFLFLIQCSGLITACVCVLFTHWFVNTTKQKSIFLTSINIDKLLYF